MPDRILVRGVGSHNGGAELLLRATLERLRTDENQIVTDVRKVSAALRSKWDLGPYLTVPRFGAWESVGLNFVPTSIARAAHVPYSSRHVTGVVDASGFFLGDQWNEASIRRDAAVFARFSTDDRPVVMLPQAFGPFAKPEIARAALALLEQVDVIYARDRQSLNHLAHLLGSEEGIGLCPDITIGLEPSLNVERNPERVAVVPNINLVSRSNDDRSLPRYASALAETHRLLRQRGLEPFFLVHSSHGDPSVVAAALSLIPGAEVQTPADGLEAKSIIAGCGGLIGGRYHALVSALSQGVPSVAHSWSHKYGALLSDFGVDRGLADPMDATGSVDLLESLRSDPAYHAALAGAKPSLVAQIDKLWANVRTTLGVEEVRVP